MHSGDDKLKSALDGTGYIVFDGAMGTMLQQAGIDSAGEAPDILNLSHPEAITGIHRAYVEAGADVITTNTFGANPFKLKDKASIRDVFAAGIACAREAQAPYVAADIGPSGALFEPMGELTFEKAYEIFSEQARSASAAGCNLVIIETMADLLEMKAAVLAVKENTDLPLFATMTFNDDGHTLMGTSPKIAALALNALGVDALGINCSVGPKTLVPFIAEMSEFTALPLIAQPNAGLPQVIDGKAQYGIDVEEFMAAEAELADAGATVLGSCCGTTPQYTAAIVDFLKDKKPRPRGVSPAKYATSARVAVSLEAIDIERDVYCLNEKEKLSCDDIVDAVYDALDEDAEILRLDVDSIDAEDIDRVVREVQSMTAQPLAFSGEDESHVRMAARCYSGVAAVGIREVAESCGCVVWP